MIGYERLGRSQRMERGSLDCRRVCEQCYHIALYVTLTLGLTLLGFLHDGFHFTTRGNIFNNSLAESVTSVAVEVES